MAVPRLRTLCGAGFLALARCAGGAEPPPSVPAAEIRDLVRQLGSTSFKAREAAQTRLLEIGRGDPERLLSLLPKDVEEMEVLVRCEEIRLGMARERLTLRALEWAKGDAPLEDAARACLAEMFGWLETGLRMESSSEHDELSAFVDLIDRHLRWMAYQDPPAGRKRRAAGVIATLAGAPRAQAQLAAVRIVGALGETSAATEVLEHFGSTKGLVRCEAIGLLGDLKCGEAVYPLIACLREEDPQVRSAAAMALAKLDARQAVDDVARLLSDPDPGVRWQAAMALWQFPGLMDVSPTEDPVRAATAWWKARRAGGGRSGREGR